MNPLRRTASLVAERAVRFLRSRDEPVGSIDLVREILSTKAGDELAARAVLETAFGGDPRLVYADGRWNCVELDEPRPSPVPELSPEQDRTLVLIEGGKPDGKQRYEIRNLAVIRVRGDEVVDACGGEPAEGPLGDTLRRGVLAALDGAVPVIHDPPGSLAALERWLDEPLDTPISLRRLAADRIEIRSNHDLETLAARLGLEWHASDDLADLAEVVDDALRELMRENETLAEVRLAVATHPPVPWERYAFDRAFVRELPQAPGTYRFFDSDGNLLYIGKSKNLHRRVSSYFATNRRRSKRQQALLEALHRIEFEALHSDLEAVLQEAIAIQRDDPEHNVQRNVHTGSSRSRIRSIVILEPAAPPLVLRAYLIREGRLIDKVGIGPRGGGLRRVERILEDYFFAVPWGPTTTPGPDLDVELVTRWLAKNRDQAVAFDPTNLPGPQDVTERIRYFLGRDALLDPDGSPTQIR